MKHFAILIALFSLYLEANISTETATKELNLLNKKVAKKYLKNKKFMKKYKELSEEKRQEKRNEIYKKTIKKK